MLDLALFRSRGFTGAVVVATIGMFAVSHHQAGMAGAGLNALRQTGGALGPAVLGALLTSRAVSSLPTTLASHGITGPAQASVLNVVQQAGLGGAAAYPYGAHASAVQAAFGDSLTHAMHICTLVGAAVLVLAALAALLIEHGPRLFARRPQPGPLALGEAIADTLPDS